MKIVILVRNYLPKPNAVGICANKIIHALQTSDDGNQIIVVCEKNNIDQLDYEVIDGVEVYRFLTSETQSRLLLNKYSSQTFLLRIYIAVKEYILRAKYYIKDLFYNVTEKPELTSMFFQALNELPLGKNDCIIPFSAPFESVIAASNYIEKNRSVLLIPVLYDLFSDNPFIHKNCLSKILKYKKNRRLEQKMFELSTHILCPNYWLTSLSYYKQPEKITIVDVPFLEKTTIGDSKSTEIVYCGNFQHKIRKTDYLARFISRFLISTKTSVTFRFIGNGNSDRRLRRLRNAFPDRVFLDGFVPHDTAIEIMKSSLGLIVVANERNNQTPSKVFECMSMLKPILYFTKNKGTDLVEGYLSKYPISIIIKRCNKISANCNNLDAFLEQMPNSTSFEDIEERFQRATPNYSADVILNCKNRSVDRL